ncbi:MAG TPA: hypothetical protein VN426_17825 [Syntrophomonadaceae bacterium]|nr:hypothetical protein [Syntrophomonadaceae bacterium]
MSDNPFNVCLYRAFGLNIQCELPTARIFGMSPIDHTLPDVVMRLTKVPHQLEKADYKDAFISIAEGCLLLNIKGVARYLIRDGKEISIDIDPGAQDGDVATFAFGSALGALLYQRGILAIHGSAVRTPKGAVIFSGEKGAGKSTLASALSSRGWDFMSDDVCAIHIENNTPMLYPGLSRAKLAADSYSYVYGHKPEELPISPILKKYGASFNNRQEPCPLYAICTLETSKGSPCIEPVIGAERLLSLTRNIYRPIIHNLVEQPVQRFRQYTLAASSSRTFRVFRPVEYSQMSSFLEMLEEELLA